MLKSFIKTKWESFDFSSLGRFIGSPSSVDHSLGEDIGLPQLGQVCSLSPGEVLLIRKQALSTLRLTSMHSMGASASRYYGAGLEFDSVREYDVGDDVRRLDWNVTARTGKLHTKVFTEDRSLNICALLSVSQTMHYSTSKLLKVEVGARFARVLFELARAQNDFFTGVVVNSSTLHVQKSSQSAAAWVRFIKLVQLASRTLEQQPSTTQRLGMMGIATSILRGSLVFVISDFLDPNELQDLKKMKTLFDIVVVRILDKAEISFESHLPINLKGHGLGGGDLNVKLGTAQASSANQCLKKANGELVEFCQREGLLLIELSTGTDDYVTPLVKALRERRGRE